MGIPAALRSTMIRKLHSSHLRLQGSLRREREAFYWSRMNKQLAELMSKCEGDWDNFGKKSLNETSVGKLEEKLVKLCAEHEKIVYQA